MEKITILGAGASGLSCSFHLGHQNCDIFERNSFSGGHIYSHNRDGCIWDEGPHVSFTQHQYVKDLFEESVEGNFLEYEVNLSNYYKGNWIPHPAQSNLWAFPQSIRKSCLDDFLKSREKIESKKKPANYLDWIEEAFGKTFANTFTAIYTDKYWTCNPSQLATDWVGNRVFYPDIETVKKGYISQPDRSSHYVKKVRYPSKGGYVNFLNKFRNNAKIHFNHEVEFIDFEEKFIKFKNGKQHQYERLISTLPITELIKAAIKVPNKVMSAVKRLRCSSVLLVNVTANHDPLKPFHWLYVYDKDKISTRINHIDLLSPNNTPIGKTGIQVEVYSSPYRPFNISHQDICKRVVQELQEMGLIKKPETAHTQFVQYANVIFDHERREAQECVLTWLEQFGLKREKDDLDPMTDWQTQDSIKLGQLVLAGRFAQWKYFWSDDCILRGKFIGKNF